MKTAEETSRRAFFKKSALFTAGLGAATTLTAPGIAHAAAWGGDKDWKHDAALLNVALNLEHQAIAAYQVGAESKLLTPAVLKIALAFQKDHEAHAAILTSTIRKIGGVPVAAKAPLNAPMATLAKAWNFPVGKLKNQADVLHFAAGLEIGAAKAYLGTVPEFGDRALAKAAANIEGDETMHYAILRNALGEFPVPAAFVSGMPS